MHRLFLPVFLTCACHCFAFNGRDTALYKAHRQLRFHYANDVYNQTDRYLTQMAAFRLWTPFIPHHNNAQISNTYSIQQNVYTPSDIFGDTIQQNDRPYASTLAFEYGRQIFYNHRLTLVNFNFTMGTIGKKAFGEQMQREVHYAVNSRQALGWQYQVSGAPYINFQAGLEKQMTRLRHFDYALQGQINTGTVFNNIALGQAVHLHSNANYFAASNNSRLADFRISATMKNEIKLVGWNGSLQGGIGSQNNPYTLTGQNISRIVAYHQLALQAGYRHLNITFSKSFISKEFHTGLKHKWCAVEFCYLF